jgi:hypothetical protein
MSLLNKASLIQIPSGYKDGTLYSAKPTNGDGDFTFSRGSNLAATRVNSEGLIEKGRENLLLQSNSFDTTWVTSSASVNGGQTGYDGSSDAWLLSKTGDYGRVEQNTSASGIYTLSVYAKSGTLDWLSFENSGISADTCFFDLSNGVLGSKGAGVVSTSIQSIGNGWYRCSAIFNGAFGISRIQPSISDGVVNGTNGNIYIQDAQLEVGLVSTDVITTTTTTEQAGILEDMPRLDYSGGATCPSLLLEGQRSNALAHSEYLNGIVTFGGTNTDNATTSPEGLVNSGLYTENTANTYHRFNTGNQSYTQNQAYTFSVFAKSYSDNRFLIVNCVSAFGARTYFDLSDGTKNVVSGTADIQDYGNGWYRCSVTGTRTAATGTDSIYFGLNTTEADSAYTGDGTSGMYFWGAQLEEGSYSTSYIPTYGASVTRSEDYSDNAGDSSVFNDTEGVLYLESSWLSNELGTSTIAISDGSTSNRIILGYIGADDDLYCTSIGGGSSPSLMSYDVGDITTNHKIAIKYKANDFAFWVDGVERGTQSSGTTPVGLNELNFSSGTGGSKIFGNMKQILYFPTALTDDELASLTTI